MVNVLVQNEINLECQQVTMMNKPLQILLFLISVIGSPFCSFGTEQESDVLVIKSDTIRIDVYPLEELMEKNEAIKAKFPKPICIDSGCWRDFVGYYRIENDSLFLTDIISYCDNKRIPLNKVFSRDQIKCNKVFVWWFTDIIRAGFGSYYYKNFYKIYYHAIRADIKNGVVLSITQSENIIPPEPKVEQDSNEVYIIADTMARFPYSNCLGSVDCVKNFLNDNPVYTQRVECEGKVYVKFIVERDGSISNIRIIRGIENCLSCNDDAIRVIKLMPSWEPAKFKGKTVRVYYVLAVRIKYDNTKTQALP